MTKREALFKEILRTCIYNAIAYGYVSAYVDLKDGKPTVIPSAKSNRETQEKHLQAGVVAANDLEDMFMGLA